MRFAMYSRHFEFRTPSAIFRFIHSLVARRIRVIGVAVLGGAGIVMQSPEFVAGSAHRKLGHYKR